MQGHGLVVRFVLRTGHEQAFDELVSKTLAGIRDQEPGTLIYVSHEVPDQPGVRVFYELYQDRDAFDVHELQPHVRHFLQARSEHVESYTVDFLNVVDGKAINRATP